MKYLGKFICAIVCATFALSGFAGNKTSSATNKVSLIPDTTAIKYNPMIFGQFIEHFDNQVYGGLFDPESEFADEDGFRTDVIEALKEIKTPIVRWPGGCFVSSYHWLEGVGPERTPVYDKSWQVEDPNTFGTDEFIKWCRKVGCEPYICTNAGTGTPEEMSDWVEYCNLNIGKFGRMRIANGYPEPHNVKYWSVGNENWGAHELGARTVEEWGPMVRESAKLMRAVTKDAKLFAAATSNPGWSIPLLQKAGYLLDYISVHGYWDPCFHYNNPQPFEECMMRTDLPEKDILKTIEILDSTGFGNGRIKIAYDEWNLRNWHHPWHGDFRRGFELDKRRKNDIASTYTMADALFASCFLNSCLRHSDIVEIACFSPIVNTRGALFVHPKGILKRTTFHVFKMYTNMLEEHMVPSTTVAEQLTKDTRTTNALDVVVTANADRSRYVLAVVNKDASRDLPLTLDFAGMGLKAPKSIKATVLSGSTPDDFNDIAHPDRVTPTPRTLKVASSSVTIPAHSLTFLTLE